MDLLIATLLIVGLALMALEAIVPKMGILAISGTLCFVLALYYLKNQGLLFGFEVDNNMLLAFAAVGCIVLAGSIYFIWRVANQLSPDPLVGQTARVVEWSGDKGRVHIEGDTWNAQSAQSFSVGDLVEITGFDPLAHLTVIVRSK